MNAHRRLRFLLAGALSSLGLAPPAVESSQLTLLLRDGPGLAPVAARVQVQTTAGWLFDAPDSTLWTRNSTHLGSYVHAEDSLEVEVPDGPVTVRAVRGLPGIPQEIVTTVTGDQQLTLHLDLWVDASAEGWWGGDGHVHASHAQSGSATYPGAPASVTARVGRAESLDLMAILANDPANPGGDVGPGEPGVAMIWGEEYRAAYWGHVVLLGLSTLLLTDGSPGCCAAGFGALPTLRDRFALDPPPLAWLAHPHSTDNPIGALQWPGVGYARERAALARETTVHGFAVASGSNGEGSDWALEGYLDALRSGARWAAIGEGDRSLDRYQTAPPGELRTYARVDSAHPVASSAGAAAWVDAVLAGDCFATTGPFLTRFEVDGTPLGGTLAVAAQSQVTVDLEISSWAPIEQVTLYGATGVHWTAAWPGGTTSVDETVDLVIAHDDFVVVEAVGPAGDWTTAPEGPRLVSSPVWIDAGTPWVMPVDPARRSVDELKQFWDLSRLDRPYETSADSMVVADYLLGAAAWYEAAVDDPPAPFALSLPVDTAELPSTAAVLSWTPSVSYDGEAVLYRALLDDDPLFSSPTWGPLQGATSTSWPGLTAGQTYWWNVEAHEPGEPPGLASNGPWQFSISSTPVPVPTTPRLRVGPARWTGARARIQLELPRASAVALTWVDLRGRRVHRQSWSHLAAGDHQLSWDGVDSRGQRVASATYFGVVEAMGRRRVTRVLVPGR